MTRHVCLNDQPWWTLEDQALFDLLIWRLVNMEQVSSEAIQRVIDWRDSRIIRAKARWAVSKMEQ